MRDSRHPEALRLMAFCLRQAGQLEDAAKCARALAKEKPREEASWFLLGSILYDLERDDEARSALEQALQLAPAECPFLFDIYKFIGNACVRAGDFDAAEECYNKAFAVNPASDALMVNYGTLEIQREQLELAVERFRSAVDINPENDRAWIGLALVHRQKGDVALAWANLERALGIAPTNRTGVRLAVEWGAVDRDFSVAVRALQAHLALEGGDAEMSYALARIFAFSRRFPEARMELERAMALEPRLDGAPELLEAVRFEERREASAARAKGRESA
jgi:Flp pilus assembly protein TadD